MTFRLGESEKKIDFVLIREHQRLFIYVKVNFGEFQHVIMVADIDKEEERNVVKMTCIERRKIRLLKHEMIMKYF